MAELVDTYDLTDPEQHGWAVDYLIRREDGEELHAAVRCWDKARTSAEQAGNADALEAMSDRGIAAALEVCRVGRVAGSARRSGHLDLVRPR